MTECKRCDLINEKLNELYTIVDQAKAVLVSLESKITAIRGTDFCDSCGDWVNGEVLHQCFLNPDACPGCGCLPGEGITDDCYHPDGCGYSKRIHGNKPD